jgi:hypothetical protein
VSQASSTHSLSLLLLLLLPPPSLPSSVNHSINRPLLSPAKHQMSGADKYDATSGSSTAGHDANSTHDSRSRSHHASSVINSDITLIKHRTIINSTLHALNLEQNEIVN